MRQIKKNLSVGLILMLVVSALTAQNTFKQEPTGKRVEEYKLVWQDNFDGTKLDETHHWTIVLNGKGGGNREMQYYKRGNIEVGKEPVSGENCLIITAKKEKYYSKKFTSGRLTTQNKLSFKYGKIEARIKPPRTANGLWPAFWLLGNDYPKALWPKCGEIDIMEMGNHVGIVESSQDRYFNGACHWGEQFNHGKYPNYAKASTGPYSLQDSFHLYTLIWDENAIKMYLDLDKFPDNPPYFEMPIQGKKLPNEVANYFQKPYFIVFNLAVGGNFTGIIDKKQITALKDGEDKMYVDYVKLYQKGVSGEELLLPTSGIKGDSSKKE